MATVTLTKPTAEASPQSPNWPTAMGSNGAPLPVVLALDLGTRAGWALHGADGAITSGTAEFRTDRWTGGGMMPTPKVSYFRF